MIALLFELAGRGLFPGYRFFGLSQRDTYDARAAILRDEEDPEEVFNVTDESNLQIVEFKKTAASVISDFARNQKSPGTIDLVVAWDEGVPPVGQFGFDNIESSRAYEASPRRVFPRAQRYIEDMRTGDQVQVLLLQPLLAGIKEAGSIDAFLGSEDT